MHSMPRPQTLTETWAESSLETKALNDYEWDLIKKVSLPELYHSNHEWWWHIVNMTDPEHMFRQWGSDYMSYKGLYHTYWGPTPKEQNRFDIFVLFMRDKDGPQNMTMVNSMGLKTPEDYCSFFNVDRTTALKMKSLYDGRVTVEPKWIKAK